MQKIKKKHGKKMSLFFFSMLQGLETFSACVVLDNIKIQIRNMAGIIRVHGKLHTDNSS